MPNEINLLYPGDAIAYIKTVNVKTGELRVNAEVTLGLDICWDHAGHPSQPIQSIVAEHLRKGDADMIFPKHAVLTNIDRLEYLNKTMTVEARFVFSAVGEYYLRVTCGAHPEITPAVYRDPNDPSTLYTVTVRA